MIPKNWREHRREDDDELIGFIEQSGSTFAARTIIGTPIGESGDEADAASVLDIVGLSYLAEQWLLTLDGRDEPIAVQIAEAGPTFVTVRSVDLGYEGDYGTPFRLEVPVDPDRLRPERPIR